MSKKKKLLIPMSYVAGLTLEEGRELMLHVTTNMRGENDKWYVHGFNVKRSFDRFEALLNCELTCFKCGKQATHFTIERHRNNVGWPYNLNVYSNDTMMTWDHILPKSMEGSDDPINARCACAICNEMRGSEMTLHEMVWAASQNPIQIYKSIKTTKANTLEVVGLVRKEFQSLGA